MDINAIEVKNFRTKLGWTQQLLADACDLSLRTIQRVERYGTASNETFMSLCAVFEVEREALTIVDEDQNESVSVKAFSVSPFSLITIAATVGIFTGAIIMYLLMK